MTTSNVVNGKIVVNSYSNSLACTSLPEVDKKKTKKKKQLKAKIKSQNYHTTMSQTSGSIFITI